LVLSNGDVVYAEWQNNMINGYGTYIGKGKVRHCFWENDVKFELDA
jgi:hypothetical protein